MSSGTYSLDDLRQDQPQKGGQYSLGDLHDAPEVTAAPPSFAARAWQFATSPLLPKGQSVTAAQQYATSPPRLSELSAPGAPDLGNLTPEQYMQRPLAERQAYEAASRGERIAGAKRGLAGAYADTMETLRGMVSPIGIATAGLSGLSRVPGAIGKVAQAGETLTGAGFGAQGGAQALQGVNQMSQQGVTPENLQQTLQGTGQAMLGGAAAGHAANEYVPSTTRAAANLAALEKVHGNAPIPVNAAHAAATDIANRLNVTGEQPHGLVQNYLERAQATDIANTHPEVAADLQQRGIPTDNPFTFSEARTMLKRVNETIRGMADSNPDKGQLQQFATGLNQDINAGAAQGGFFDPYNQARNEYRRGSQLIRGGEAAGPLIGGAAGAMLGRGAGGLATAEAAGAGAVAGRYLGKPVVGSLVRSVIERNAGGPTIAAPPAPPEPVIEGPAAEVTPQGPPGGVERRTDTAARAAFSKLSPEQQYQQAFTNHVTGLPNARAYDAASAQAPTATHGFSDVSGLKWLNDTYGKEAGDALLQAKARALQDAGVEAYHTGGDEFSMLGQDPVTLNNRLAAANQNLRNALIEVKDPATGETRYLQGAEFRYGIGPTADMAEKMMMAKKAAGKATRGTQGTLRQVPGAPQ